MYINRLDLTFVYGYNAYYGDNGPHQIKPKPTAPGPFINTSYRRPFLKKLKTLFGNPHPSIIKVTIFGGVQKQSPLVRLSITTCAWSTKAVSQNSRCDAATLHIFNFNESGETKMSDTTQGIINTIPIHILFYGQGLSRFILFQLKHLLMGLITTTFIRW